MKTNEELNQEIINNLEELLMRHDATEENYELAKPLLDLCEKELQESKKASKVISKNSSN